MSEEVGFIDANCRDFECAGRLYLQSNTARIMPITFREMWLKHFLGPTKIVEPRIARRSCSEAGHFWSISQRAPASQRRNLCHRGGRWGELLVKDSFAAGDEASMSYLIYSECDLATIF